MMKQTKPRLVAVPAPSAEHSELDLVRRAQRGDKFAMEELFVGYIPRLAGLLRRTFGPHPSLDDMLQDALVTGYAELPKLRDPTKFRPWLFRLAIFQAKRTLWRARFLQRWQSEAAALWTEEDVAPSLSADARACLVSAGERLAKAPVDVRLPWVLRHTCDMSLEEVSIACAVSLSTVKRRIATAQQYLEGFADA